MKKKRLINIAYKGLIRNKLNTFLMMIGIVIGITALTIIVSSAVGTKKSLMNRVEKFGLDSLMLFPGSGGRKKRLDTGEIVNPITLNDIAIIKKEVKSIKSIGPFAARREIDFKYENNIYTGKLLGATSTFMDTWRWYIEQGDFLSEEDITNLNKVCVLCYDVKEALFGDKNPIGEKIYYKKNQFEVIGVLQQLGVSPGGRSSMDDRVIIPITTFMKRIVNTNELDNIKILIKDPTKMNESVEELRFFLREYRNLESGQPDDFTIRTPKEVISKAKEVSGTFNILLIFITLISLIIGGIVVANIMLISVSKRKREIGLRKSVGAQNKDILFQFLIETATITTTGGMIGIILGILGIFIMKIISQLPAFISWESIILGFIISNIVGVISGIYPALKASKLIPVEVIK
jgi:putative ABC transport system permease protein